MNFMIGLLLSVNWKNNSYDSIVVIVNYSIKIVDYNPFKIIINATDLAKVTIDVVMKHRGFSELIVSKRDSLFTLKSSFFYAVFLASSKSSLLSFIFRQIVRPRNKKTQWRLISGLLSIGNRITRLGSCSCRNLYTTMQKLQMLATHLLSSTTVIIFAFFLKMKPTLA